MMLGDSRALPVKKHGGAGDPDDAVRVLPVPLAPVFLSSPNSSISRKRTSGSARREQPFDPIEPEAGIARPLVEFDPRHALVP